MQVYMTCEENRLHNTISSICASDCADSQADSSGISGLEGTMARV